MKFTKENVEQMIQEEYENVLNEKESILDIIKQTIKGVFGGEIPETEEEAAEGLQALEKEMGRRDFIRKFGLGAAGIIGTGAALKTWGKIAGRMTGEKAKAAGTGDIQMAVGKGKPQNMMPGLVPGDKIDPVWDIAPYTVQGMQAVFVSPDQIPDDYMIPGRNIPAKDYRAQLLKQYGLADLQTVKTRIESTGTWATNDYGFDYYPGPHWPDDVESPQPTLEDGPIPGVGFTMLPPDWSIALEIYQLKVLAQPQFSELPNMDSSARADLMKNLGFSDEIFLLDAYEKAQKLKQEPNPTINENRKIKIKIS